MPPRTLGRREKRGEYASQDPREKERIRENMPPRTLGEENNLVYMPPCT